MTEKVGDIASLSEGAARGVDCYEDSEGTIGPGGLESFGEGVGELGGEGTVDVESVGSADETFQQLACH